MAGAMAVVLLAAMLLAADAFPSLRNALFASQLDSSRVALLPFAGSAPQADRDHLTAGIYAALSEWQGLHLASDQDVADAVRADGAPTSTRAAAALARQLRAGRFIWGQVDAERGSGVRAQLYDVASVGAQAYMNVAKELLRRRK